MGIAVDVTMSDDLLEAQHNCSSVLGKGPGVKVMDSSVICQPEVVAWMNQVAQDKGIAVQQDIMRSGGTDAGAILPSRSGVYAGGICIPCRYTHSPVEVCDLDDIEASGRLVAALAESEFSVPMSLQLSEQVLALAAQAQAALTRQFARIDAIAEENSRKVLSAFQNHRVAEGYFAGTTGYGYDDLGRDQLDKIYAEIFGTEDALVRIQFVNGTHAITCALFGALMPGDTLVYAVGAPYDTLQSVIGTTGNARGTLLDYGIKYKEVALKNNAPDKEGLAEAVKDPTVKAVVIQRSKGYSTRSTLSVSEIGELAKIIQGQQPQRRRAGGQLLRRVRGDFEPTQVGGRPGGGLPHQEPRRRPGPPPGLYRRPVRPGPGCCPAAHHPRHRGRVRLLTGNNRALYQGLFLAPHTVAQAVKTAVFAAAKLMELMGYQTEPKSTDVRHDIIQMISLNTPEAVCKFCKGIQSGSPVDSYVTPEPWDMPGYDDQVIMAAGAFHSGGFHMSCPPTPPCVPLTPSISRAASPMSLARPAFCWRPRSC